MNYRLIDLKVNGDERGKLIAIEEYSDIVPFEIKRAYWIFDTDPDFVRGKHAHKNLEQLIVAIDGACEFVLDDGKSQKVITLNRPDKALYVGKNVWREMRNFSYGCKLIVFASEHYNPNEYIRDYNEFLSEVSCGK